MSPRSDGDASGGGVMFGHKVQASATLVALEWAHDNLTSSNNPYDVYRFIVDVTPADGSAFRASGNVHHHTRFERLPTVHDTVTVEYHPRNTDKVELLLQSTKQTKEQRAEVARQKAVHAAAWEEAAAAPPGTDADAGSPLPPDEGA